MLIYQTWVAACETGMQGDHGLFHATRRIGCASAFCWDNEYVETLRQSGRNQIHSESTQFDHIRGLDHRNLCNVRTLIARFLRFRA